MMLASRCFLQHVLYSSDDHVVWKGAVLWEKSCRDASGSICTVVVTVGYEGKGNCCRLIRRLQMLLLSYPNEGCCGRGRLMPNSQYGSRRAATGGVREQMVVAYL